VDSGFRKDHAQNKKLSDGSDCAKMNQTLAGECSMLDHVSITVSDMAAAERFYDSIMKVLGVVKVGRREDWLGYGERARPAYPERVYISIRKGARPDDAPGRHWCFKAKWRTQVDAFWDAGIAAGGSDDGPPGLRNYHASYYAAFLRDPDGNRIEAVCNHQVGGG
jgi:catechol 2,3-dioxygenase-like lactoylglutathione lyase family enzyme